MKTLCALLLALTSVAPCFAQNKEDDRMKESYQVMKEILGMPESIPKDLLDKAECIVIYPSVKKAAFIVGGS